MGIIHHLVALPLSGLKFMFSLRGTLQSASRPADNMALRTHTSGPK